MRDNFIPSETMYFSQPKTIHWGLKSLRVDSKRQGLRRDEIYGFWVCQKNAFSVLPHTGLEELFI